MNKNNLPENQSNFFLYTGSDGEVNVEVFLQDETIWLTQKAIGKLFEKSKATIGEHIEKIYAEGELQIDSTVQNFRTVQMEGLRQVERNLEFYDLNVNIAVGYRINSYQATQLRIWTTKTLKKYITKDFVLNDDRLKQGNQVFSKDYFDKISTNWTQIHTQQKLRDTLLPKLLSKKVRITEVLSLQGKVE